MPQDERTDEQRMRERELALLRTIPIGSLFAGPKEETDRLYEAVGTLPLNVRRMLATPVTGAYIRGLAKKSKLSLSQAQGIARQIVRVATGDVPLAKLHSMLTREVNIPANTAGQIAKEIEKDLLAPVALDLNKYLERRKRQARTPNQNPQSTPTVPQNPRNVLNLKDKGRQSK